MTSRLWPHRWSRRELALLLVLIAVAVYANSLLNGFTMDDVFIIVRNPRVTHWTHLSDIWLTPYWYANGVQLGLYRPLSIFAYAMEWSLGVGAPVVFHLVNVVLNGVVSALVFLLIDRLWHHRTAAFFGALIFAVHPVHTEAVANVVGQAEILASLGVLVACLAAASRPGTRVSPGRLAVMVVAYLFGMLAKENAIVLPALLLLIDIAQRRIKPSWRGVLHYVDDVAFPVLMLAAAAAVYLLLRLDVLGAVMGGRLTPGFNFLRQPGVRVMTAFRAWPEYARLLFFPAHLSADYSPGVILPVTSPTPMMAIGLVLLLGTVALAVSILWQPRVGLPAAWFLVAILPISNLLFPVGVIVAERTLYLPSIAVALAAAAALMAVEARGRDRAREAATVEPPAAERPAALDAAGGSAPPDRGAVAGTEPVTAPAAAAADLPADDRRAHARDMRLRARETVALACVAALAVGLLTARTVLRNPVWKSNDTLVTAQLRSDPESYRTQWIAASDALSHGDTIRGVAESILARRLYSGDSELNIQFAELLIKIHRTEEGIKLLEQAIHSPFFPLRANDLLAVGYLRLGHYRQALLAADRLGSEIGETFRVLQLRGYALWGLGAYPQALHVAQRALTRPRGNNWQDWVLVARIRASQQDTAQTLAALDSAFVKAEPARAAFAEFVNILRIDGFLAPHATCERFADCETKLPPKSTTPRVLKRSQVTDTK